MLVQRPDNPIRYVEPASDKVVASSVLSISDEQFAKHPMLIRMIHRLEALEGRRLPCEPLTSERRAESRDGASGVWKMIRLLPKIT